MSLKNGIADIADSVHAAWSGSQRLVEAASLVVVSVFSVYSAQHNIRSDWGRHVIIIAAGIIGLRGAYEFIRCLAYQGKGARAQEMPKKQAKSIKPGVLGQ